MLSKISNGVFGRICFISADVENGGAEELNRILDIFKKYNTPATLFVTGEVLGKYQNLAKEWGKNYEIASHSFTHRFWDKLSRQEREKELDGFINLYQKIFNRRPAGFRAPSHIIDKEGVRLLEDKGFLYDSSIVPHYLPFKKYRGYGGKAPLSPYYPDKNNIKKQYHEPVHGTKMRILEIPVTGQIFGIPLAGAWIAKLPPWLYKILFFIHCPEFITLSIHSWDEFENLDKIIKLLKNKNYQFLNGAEIFHQNRKY